MRIVRQYRPPLLVLLMMLSTGCAGAHSALDPAGPQAGHIARLWWIFFAVCVTTYAVVLLFTLVGGVFRGRAQAAATEPPITIPDTASEQRLSIVVSTFVGVTVVILFVLLFSDFVSGRAIHRFSLSSNPVAITITGHQWWWEVRYDDSTPSNIITTANEIHIPIGRPIKIELQRSDVIHSFWVPNLHGKKDLIPGHSTAIYLQADRGGTYYGQCAEFCGAEHAKMRLVVIAESADKFHDWLTAALRPAPEPVYANQKRGQEVFLSSSCVLCHAISGTPAGAR